jgi:uncharacterized membrane protein
VTLGRRRPGRVEPAVQTVADAVHERAWRDPAASRARAAQAFGALRAALRRPLAFSRS